MRNWRSCNEPLASPDCGRERSARTRAGSRGTVQPAWLCLLPCHSECPHRLGESCDVAAGLAQLREGLEALRGLRAEIRLPYYCALLAETFGRAGLVGEALASLSTGFGFASKNGEEWAVAELHRVQGNLLAAEGKAEPARASYRRGLDAAQRSGSLAFEQKLLILAGGTAASASTERS